MKAETWFYIFLIFIICYRIVNLSDSFIFNMNLFFL